MSKFKQKLEEAVIFATKKHENQKRKSLPWPYIVHIYEVAKTLVENGASQDAILASVLHDTVEDTDTTLEEIEEKFGSQIAYLVDMVTEDKSLEYVERKKKQAEKIMYAGKDVKMIKCADLYSNLRSIFVQSRIDDRVWGCFNSTKENIEVNYKDMINAISDEVKDTQMFKDVVRFYEDIFGKKLTFDKNNARETQICIFKCMQPFARVDGKKIRFCNDCKYFSYKYNAGNFYEDETYYEFNCKKLNKVLSSYNLKNNTDQQIPEDCPYIEQ